MAYTTIQDSINALLLKQQDAIKALTFDNATNKDLIMASVIAKKMEEVSKLDIGKMQVSATLAGITTSSAVASLLSKPDLQQWIVGAGNLEIFQAYLSDDNILAEIVNTAAIMSDIAISSTAMAAVAASSTAMAAVIASSTAMAAVAASSTAMAAVIASSTAMAAVAASSTAMAAVAASSTAMAAVIASSTAMAAVIASSTAMAAVAASSTAMAAINTSDSALTALYASPLVTKVSYSSGQVWSSTVTLRNGKGLFVRLTTKAGCAGWGEGNLANEWMSYDGSNVYFAERNTNPYNHTATTSGATRHPARRFATSLAIRPYQACEIAYIPLTA